jgi:WD40 repeat protein
VRLWNVESGLCIYNLTCHTCADLKFDDMQVVTASYDNTVTRWEWKTGNCLTMYEGHVAAGRLKKCWANKSGRGRV